MWNTMIIQQELVARYKSIHNREFFLNSICWLLQDEVTGTVAYFVGIKIFTFVAEEKVVNAWNSCLHNVWLMTVSLLWPLPAGMSGGWQSVYSDHCQRDGATVLHPQRLWQHCASHHPYSYSLGAVAARMRSVFFSSSFLYSNWLNRV